MAMDPQPNMSHYAPIKGIARVLKDGEMFGVFDEYGNICAKGSDDLEGVFLEDMRILSRWVMKLEQVRLIPLYSETEPHGLVYVNYLSNVRVNGSGPAEDTLVVKREKILYDQCFYERFEIRNKGLSPVVIDFILEFSCDFKDLFELRGALRNNSGLVRDMHVEDNLFFVHYRGSDSIDRYSRIRFYKKPDRIEQGQVAYTLTLASQQSWDMTCQVAPLIRAGTNLDFREARRQGRNRLDDKKSNWTLPQTSRQDLRDWLEAASNTISLLSTDREEGGFYPYAGVPWFNAPFGRDGLITGLQVLEYNPALARGVLEFLATHQGRVHDREREEEPGKILHEMRRSELANTGEVAFGRYYGSVDSTPLFIMLACAYFKTQDDPGFLDKLSPALDKAVSWIETSSGQEDDGFLRYISHNPRGLETQAWKDSENSASHSDGTLAEPPVAFCEVQGYAYAAYRAMAELNRKRGRQDEAQAMEGRACEIYNAFNTAFWNEESGYYAIALDKDRKPCRVLSSNLGHLLYTGIVPKGRAKRVIEHLLSPRMFTGYGLRTLAAGEARYAPMSYHNGSVWPHDTAIAAAGMARYGYHKEARILAEGLLDAAKKFSPLYLPELFCGFDREDGVLARYPAACLQQSWAAGAAFMCAEILEGREKGGI